MERLRELHERETGYYDVDGTIVNIRQCAKTLLAKLENGTDDDWCAAIRFINGWKKDAPAVYVSAEGLKNYLEHRDVIGAIERLGVA